MVSPSKTGAGNLTSSQPRLAKTFYGTSVTLWPVTSARAKVESTAACRTRSVWHSVGRSVSAYRFLKHRIFEAFHVRVPGSLSRLRRGQNQAEDLGKRFDAERLLIVEVMVLNGHWSSYPPHKQDQDNRTHETYLEETGINVWLLETPR